MDYTDFAPVHCDTPDNLKGAVIGNDKARIGWFRDARCVPPDWPTNRVSDQAVAMDAPGNAWQAEFFNPETGKAIGEARLAALDGRIRVVLPDFHESIAFRLKQL